MVSPCRRCGGPKPPCSWKCVHTQMKSLDLLEKMSVRGRVVRSQQRNKKKINRRRARWRAAGTLVLWPNTLLDQLLERVCAQAQNIQMIKRKLGLRSDTVHAYAALPVELSCSSDCKVTIMKPSRETFCVKDCDIKRCFEGQISHEIVKEARDLSPNAEVRPHYIKGLMDNFANSFSDVREEFKGSTHSWICAIEGVTEEGMKTNENYCHVDCNISGWGSDKTWDKSRKVDFKEETGCEDLSQADLAKRETLEETGLQVKLLLDRKEIKEYAVLSFQGRRVWMYVPTNDPLLSEESIEIQEAILSEKLAKLEAIEVKQALQSAVCE